MRPPHAVLVLGDGRREKIRNTNQLRERVLDITAQIRKARSDLRQPLRVVTTPAKCRACAQRQNCDQRVAKKSFPIHPAEAYFFEFSQF